MKSLRARAILKSLGFTKKANGHYIRNEVCTWCEGLDSTDCWVCRGSGESTGWLILDQFKEVIRASGYPHHSCAWRTLRRSNSDKVQTSLTQGTGRLL